MRDLIVSENYEVASDPQVILSQHTDPIMIYSGDDGGNISIKLAKRVNIEKWAPSQVLIASSTEHQIPRFKETPFIYKLGSEYQLYFIGYDDEESYKSQIYLAVSQNLEGPYKLLNEPVIPSGIIAGHDVHTITSPSIIEHEGQLKMTFLGWDDFANVTKVWVLGAVSRNAGRDWEIVGEVRAPIGMEG